MAELQTLQNTLHTLGSNLKKLQDMERFCQTSKEKLTEDDITSNKKCVTSTARNKLSKDSQFDKTCLKKLERNEQEFVRTSKIEKEQILKRTSLQLVVNTGDNEYNALEKWRIEIQNTDECTETGNRLFYNCRLEEEPIGIQTLSFSTSYQEICVNLTISHNRNGQPFKNGLIYHTTSDLYVTHLEHEAVQHLTSGATATSFVTNFIWKYFDKELFQIL
ncbi:uncharacterized protein [Antedon mediterranea]|uniref:uncharacterized protein n=1 Tax=Antedon mediterranea TaxID=105859 RepID=UPI003AF60708